MGNRALPDQQRNLLTQSREEVVRDLRERHPHRAPMTLELIAQARRETKRAAFAVLAPPNPDYRQLVGTIGIPSLLVIGDNGVVSAELSSSLQAITPKLQITQIGAAGYGIFYDQPDQFAAILAGFCQGLSRTEPTP